VCFAIEGDPRTAPWRAIGSRRSGEAGGEGDGEGEGIKFANRRWRVD